jgi:hypothetical protein
MTGYAPAPTSTRSNGMAVAGFVLSIIGIFLFNIILGPLGVIFGGVGLSRANRGASNRGLAIAAVVIGVLDIVVFAMLIAFAAHGHVGFRWHA